MDRGTLKRAAPLVAGVCLVGFLVFVLRPLPEDDLPKRNGGGQTSEHSPEAIRDLVRLANRASGQLENNKFDEANAAFLEISRELPDETLGARNLTIGRLLAFEEGTADQSSVDEAWQLLAAVDPDSAVTHWLKARIALKAMELATDNDTAAAERATASASLAEAARLDPENVVYPFGRFEIDQISGELSEEGFESLRTAQQLAPQNLFLLGDWLLALAKRQAPEMVATLTAAKQAIAPLRRKNQRFDLFQFADRAIAAAKENNHTAVSREVQRAFVNLMRHDDMAKSDRRILHPHPLEFTVRHFSDSVLQRAAQAREMPQVQLTLVPESNDVPAGTAVSIHLVDANLDDKLDLAVLGDDELRILEQDEQDRWVALTAVELPSGSRGVLAADLDHDRNRKAVDEPDPTVDRFDADVDFVAYGASGITVLRNDRDEETGNRTLRIVEQPQLSAVRDVQAGILIDFDHDSDLDLIVSTGSGVKALRAEGPLSFTDVTEFSVLPQANLNASSLVAVDWDHDVDIDIVLASGGTRIGYLENLRHGTFRWVPFDESFADLNGSSSVAVLDADGNVSWDLCGAGAEGVWILRTASIPTGTVVQSHSTRISSQSKSGLHIWDYNNDSYLDLISWGGGSLEIHQGGPNDEFALATDLFRSAPDGVTGCDIGDLDNDGDQDLAVLTDSEILLYRNEGGNRNPWLQVRALGQVDNKGKVNHHGIGSLLEVKAGLHYQAQVVQRPVTHFGLGRHANADVLRFLWTNGIPQAIVSPQSNQAVCEPMELKGSCPYLYAWDGERFSFVTDLLWAAPLGLQVAEGQLAPARPWEYLLVTGDQLKPRDGHYDLRVTEELWEAAYFDQIELVAVDHPADVDIFSNEKVGPASIAQHTIHTAHARRLPIAARDKRGRDVLDFVRAADGDFFQGFDRNLLPGLVDEHFLELDLGEIVDPSNIRLFLTGWIYPTDTSLNIAISQDPDAEAPRPPSIQVPDSEGVWREVVPYMGFPGGKTKTIVVDLSNAFLTNDFRLRVVTSAEIYWDQVFFTVDEAAAAMRVTPLSIESAELRYGGFSLPLPKQPRAPEVYDYERRTAAAKWPPMRGHFTRYGAVDQLLEETDDLLVVLGAGDEIAIRFPVPADEPPAGWKRDFILHNVGWDKDADLNTIYGQSVEPLPFVGMRSYPYHDGVPDSKQYRGYLREYQTRRLDVNHFWRQLAN